MPRRLSHRDLAAAIAELREELRRSRRENRNLRRENEILREAAEPLIHHAPARERFAFIHARRDRFSVKLLCRVLVTDGANYRTWVRGQRKRRDREGDDRQLLRLIVEMHAAYPAYGAERVTRELKCQGAEVGRHRVARLMRENGIAGITRRKRRNLTKPDPGAAAVRTWSVGSSPRRCPG
jgi:putative transposase